MKTQKKVSIRRENDFLWVVLPDSIGIDDSMKLQTDIESKLSSQNEKLVLDFSDTNTIYSSGFGLLIRLRKIITESGGAIYLVNVSRKIRDFFQGLNLENVFPIYATDVEFDMSTDELWKNKLSKEDSEFIFIPQLENGVYRLTFSGQMDTLNDLSPISEFKPDESIEYFLFNFENLDLVDTYGAQLLSYFIERIQNLGKKCVVYGADKILQNLFELYEPLNSCEFYDTEKEAVKSIKK